MIFERQKRLQKCASYRDAVTNSKAIERGSFPSIYTILIVSSLK